MLGFNSLLGLAKAKRGEMVPGSKYLMRVPMGVDPKTGAPRYRYIYNIHHGGNYIHHEEFHKKGALIGGTHDGKEGHFHVKHSDDTHLTVQHSGSDKEIRISKKEFQKRLHAEHANKIDQHRAHVIRTLKRIEETGMPALKARYGQYAHQYGITLASIYTHEEASVDIAKDRLADNIAHTLHEKVLPTPTERIAKDRTTFANPDHAKGMTECLQHQVEGAERALHAFRNVGDGFLLQDEAGLGKTVTAMLTAQEHGGKVLIVTPSSGKENHLANWSHAGGLFGEDVKYWKDKDSDLSADKYSSATYLDLFKSEKTTDPYTGKETKKVSLRPEFDTTKWDLIIFDESHLMQNPESAFAQAGTMLQNKCDKALYMSATPFTQLTDAHYLRKLGWFGDGDEFTEWAQNAGAKVVRSNETNGALPYKMTNPNSAVPLVTVSALMHTQGVGCRRQPILENSKHDFETLHLADVSPQHLHMLEQGEKVAEIAKDAGLGAYETAGQMTLWRKQMWEAAKLDKALGMAKGHLADGNGQVALFTESLSHSHNHLESLAKRLDSGKGHEMDPAVAKAGAAKIREILSGFAPVLAHPETGASETIADRVERVLGEHGVSHIHGTGSAEEAQNQFQGGENRVMFGSQAKAGTGMSFHDIQGDRQRLQINLSLPWSGEAHRQLSGRTDRLGQKSDPKQIWMVGDSDSERHVANIVGSKLKSMGALVAGDPGQFVNAGALQSWETSTGTHDPHLMQRAQSAEFSDAPETEDHEFEAARDHFRASVDRYKEGFDPLSDYGDKLRTKRDAESYRQRRISIAQLSSAGLKIHSHPGLRYRISGYEPGSEIHSKLKDIQRGASIDDETGDAIVHNPKVFSRLSKELGLNKMSVDTPKNLTDNTLSELRHTAAESASHAHLLVGQPSHEKALRFSDLVKGHKTGDHKVKYSSFTELTAIMKGEVPVGTVHHWADGKSYKKVGPNEWKEVLTPHAHPGQYEGAKAQGKRHARAQPLGNVKNMNFWSAIAKEQGKEPPASWANLEIDRAPDLDKVDKSSIRFWTKNDPGSQYMMTWKDPKSGKAMMSYSNEFHRRNAAKKWGEVTELLTPVTDGTAGKHFQKGYLDSNNSERMQDAHAVMAVIAHTGFRIGAEKHLEEKGTRGAGTLAVENISIKGSRIDFKFIGKKDKENTGYIEDKKLAEFLKDKIKGKKPGDRVFSSSYQDANDLCADVPFGKNVTPHNFRHVAGTVKAAEELASRPIKLTGDKQADLEKIEKVINDASKAVANHLSNTAATSRKTYIHPALIQSYLHHIGAGEHEEKFFNINKSDFGDLSVTRIRGNKTASSILDYAIKNWKPFIDMGPGHGRGHVVPPPDDAPDDVLDGYLLPDVFH